jgi:hypothetical protein
LIVSNSSPFAKYTQSKHKKKEVCNTVTSTVCVNNAAVKRENGEGEVVLFKDKP